MKFTIVTDPLDRISADLLAVGVFQAARPKQKEGEPKPKNAPEPKPVLSPLLKGLDKSFNGDLSAILAAGEFKAKLGDVYVDRKRDAMTKRVLLVGLGKKEKYSLEQLRNATASAAKKARDLGLKGFATALHLEPVRGEQTPSRAAASVEGAMLGLYRFTRYKTDDKDEKKDVDTIWLASEKREAQKVEKAAHAAQVVCEGVMWTRDLINTPSNEKPPRVIADEAVKVGKEAGFKVTVHDKKSLEKMGMGGILGVGKGSVEEPRLIVCEHKPPRLRGKYKTIAVVGKAITFDSGGISIKPSEGMEKMKYDMAGGAAVIGVMRSVAKLGLPVHVIGVVCSAENMPGGSAQRPGDIVKIYNGKTVEVLNTDAEGRMVLADGLAWVSKEHKPDAIIDMATLTGAVQVALGNVYIGGMTNDQALLNRLLAAGRRTWERVWQLPMGEEYTEMMKGDVADLKNISGGRGAGTIVGAAFLENFVNERPWVHLDIASTAWQDDASKPYQPKGATAVGVRLLLEFLRSNSA